MTVQEWEKDFYGNNVTITTRDNECVIYRIRDDSGDSVLTRFEVYPGIALIYNDVHTDYISIKELVGYENILEINHCREGRIEFESSEGECLYVKKGDMAINMKAGVKSYSYFPQSHYHGVTIEIDFDKIEKNQNRTIGAEKTKAIKPFGPFPGRHGKCLRGDGVPCAGKAL